MPEDFNPPAKAEELAQALRPVGLYEDRSHWVSDGEPLEFVDPEQAPVPTRKILVMELFVGELAFSKRIQNPAQVDFDAQFNMMMGGLKTSEYDDTRDKIIRKLQEGLNPFEED